jgi:hypothetical protein
MKLTVKKRLLIGAVLPRQGTIAELRVLKKLAADLSLTKEEQEAIGARETTLPDGQKGVVWDEAKDPMKEVEIGEQAKRLIARSLQSLSEGGELMADHMDLYEEFVGSK